VFYLDPSAKVGLLCRACVCSWANNNGQAIESRAFDMKNGVVHKKADYLDKFSATWTFMQL